MSGLAIYITIIKSNYSILHIGVVGGVEECEVKHYAVMLLLSVYIRFSK